VGKVVVSEFVSLDGVMAERWSFRSSGKEQPQYKFDDLAAADALLLGRVTYEGFAAAWPSVTDEGGFAERMNGYPKYVGSTTLQEPLEWNNSTIIKGNVAEEVSRLKQHTGKDILIFGSADLVNTLMPHNLIDEYRLMVFPIVVGRGKRLFGDGIDTTVLELVDTKAFGSGVVVLTYRPAQS